VTPLKHEFGSVGQLTVGVALLGLVLIGIGGTIYKVISPEGWVAHAFGRSVSAGVAALGSLLMIAGLAWFSAVHRPDVAERHVLAPKRKNHDSSPGPGFFPPTVGPFFF
jgi:hypothetical protein